MLKTTQCNRFSLRERYYIRIENNCSYDVSYEANIYHSQRETYNRRALDIKIFGQQIAYNMTKKYDYDNEIESDIGTILPNQQHCIPLNKFEKIQLKYNIVSLHNNYREERRRFSVYQKLSFEEPNNAQKDTFTKYKNLVNNYNKTKEDFKENNDKLIRLKDIAKQEEEEKKEEKKKESIKNINKLIKELEEEKKEKEKELKEHNEIKTQNLQNIIEQRKIIEECNINIQNADEHIQSKIININNIENCIKNEERRIEEYENPEPLTSHIPRGKMLMIWSNNSETIIINNKNIIINNKNIIINNETGEIQKLSEEIEQQKKFLETHDSIIKQIESKIII